MRTPPRSRRILASFVMALAFAFVPAASAHSFLVRSTPQAGARLAHAPQTLRLDFSEPFVPGSERVSIQRAGGVQLELAKPAAGRATVRQRLPGRLRGVFVVRWRVLSDDGHISLGEFAFAVGSNAALPTLSEGNGATSKGDVVASWVFVIGLALALGGLASERFVWRRRGGSGEPALEAPVLAGVGLAIAGVVAQLILLAGAERGGGFLRGLSGAALADAFATRPGRLGLAMLAGLAVAGALLVTRTFRLVAVAPLFAVVVLEAARGHSGTSSADWAVVADAVHLAAVALWIGALAHLVLVLARTRDERRPHFGEAVRRYARLALPTVLVVSASGVLTALPEFRSLGAVFTSGYGQTLLVKAALIGGALAIALVARTRALPANAQRPRPLLRRLTSAELGVLAAVLIAAAVLVNVAPPRGPAAVVSPLGPPPVAADSVQLAELAGQLVVALSASARELQFQVVPPSDQPTGELELAAEARRPGGRMVDLYPRPCGDGCFAIRFRPTAGTTDVIARVSSSMWHGGEARYAFAWPLPRARSHVVADMRSAMKRVPSLSLREAVTSGPRSNAQPTTYTLSGRAFLATEAFGPAPAARVLSQRGGLTELAFAVPGSRIWYRMWIDAQKRLRRELILSPGHRIYRTFHYPRTAPGGLVQTTDRTPRPSDAPLVLAQEAGDLAVGIAFRPVGRRVKTTATVIDGNGHGVAALRLRFTLQSSASSSAAARICGSGCYRATLAPDGRPRTLLVDLRRLGQRPQRLRFRMPARWPAPEATQIVRRATSVYRHLRTLVIHERLASDPTNVVVTTWKLEAPNRLSYRSVGGGEAVIIGDRRWDREQAGAPWQASATSPLVQPTPAWISAPARAALLGSGRSGGRAVWIVSFLDRDIPAWYTLAIDKRSLRTLELRMVAPAHFMHHRYSAFDAPIRIRPPASG